MSRDSGREEQPMAARTAALELGACLRIKDVDAAHRLLEPTLRAAGPVRIDLSRLTDIDTAGVQLLIAYHRDAARLGVDARFVSAPAALVEALRLLGLDGALAGRFGQ